MRWKRCSPPSALTPTSTRLKPWCASSPFADHRHRPEQARQGRQNPPAEALQAKRYSLPRYTILDQTGEVTNNPSASVATRLKSAFAPRARAAAAAPPSNKPQNARWRRWTPRPATTPRERTDTMQDHDQDHDVGDAGLSPEQIDAALAGLAPNVPKTTVAALSPLSAGLKWANPR